MLHKMMVTTDQTLYYVFASTLALGTGCDPGEVEQVEFRPIGGVWLNTSSIGPKLFSQLDLDGKVLDGLTLTDVLVQRPNDQWLRLDRIDIVGRQIQGRRDVTSYTNQDLVGSRWLLSPAQGEPVEMWISAHTVISSAETRYTFQTLGPGGTPVHVCEPDAQGDHSAIPIKDLTVNHETGAMATRKGTMFVACTSGAVGKAIMWGYDPDPIADFEVAVRMVRADYCFDGASWTTYGKSVQVRDTWKVNTFRHPKNMTEAVWTPTGIACLSQPRWSAFSAVQVSCNGASIPTCPANVGMSTYPQTMLWTKLAAQPIP